MFWGCLGRWGHRLLFPVSDNMDQVEYRDVCLMPLLRALEPRSTRRRRQYGPPGYQYMQDAASVHRGS